MHSSLMIEKIRHIPRFKKPSKTWKEVKVYRQHAKNGETVSVKSVINMISRIVETEEEKWLEEEIKAQRDLEMMYGEE